MARHEDDREDLMREAVALVRRIELRAPHETEPITAGWRDTGWFSIYFGQDPAYHFDELGRLRRAYAGGFLYRTQGTTLARLVRERTPSETVLVRHDLCGRETEAFLGNMRGRLERLQSALDARTVETLRTEGDAVELLSSLASALERIVGQTEPLAPPIAKR